MLAVSILLGSQQARWRGAHLGRPPTQPPTRVAVCSGMSGSGCGEFQSVTVYSLSLRWVTLQRHQRGILTTTTISCATESSRSMPCNAESNNEVMNLIASAECNFALQVVRVQRVQNSMIWKSYAFNRRQVLQQRFGSSWLSGDLRLNAQSPGTGTVVEVPMWHGTKQLNPMEILSDEVGWCSSYATVGVYGRGTQYSAAELLSCFCCIHEMSVQDCVHYTCCPSLWSREG